MLWFIRSRSRTFLQAVLSISQILNIQIMNSPKIANVRELISTLLVEYGITKPQQTSQKHTKLAGSDANGAELLRLKKLSEEKEHKCSELNFAKAILQKENYELRLKIYDLEIELTKDKAKVELEVLRERISIYERTFQEEEKLVLKLQNMLEDKQRQMQTLIHEYQGKLATAAATHSALFEVSQSQIQIERDCLKQSVKELNSLLKKQQIIMAELLERNQDLEKKIRNFGRVNSNNYEDS